MINSVGCHFDIGLSKNRSKQCLYEDTFLAVPVTELTGPVITLHLPWRPVTCGIALIHFIVLVPLLFLGPKCPVIVSQCSFPLWNELCCSFLNPMQCLYYELTNFFSTTLYDFVSLDHHFLCQTIVHICLIQIQYVWF